MTDERPTLFSGATASAKQLGDHAGKAVARALRASGAAILRGIGQLGVM